MSSAGDQSPNDSDHVVNVQLAKEKHQKEKLLRDEYEGIRKTFFLTKSSMRLGVLVPGELTFSEGNLANTASYLSGIPGKGNNQLS